MKVALVHDYLNEFGGAERVLLALSEIYPKAPIYTIYAKKSSRAYQQFKNKEIIESWFSRLPFPDKLISPFRFLIPLVWRSFSFKKYDIVITSASWAVTKGFKKGTKTKEFCYLHTPPRYLYGYETSRHWQEKWYGGLVKTYALVVNHFMRIYDFNQAQKVDYFMVNSQNVGRRAEKFYRRDYKVIYPPVNIQKFLSTKTIAIDGSYFLAGGRLTAAKNFDLIIKACRKTNASLKIFGTGVEERFLRKLAKGKVEFLGSVTDEQLASYYKNAKGFILAQKDEDFGITPIEAAAAGTPVIAYQGGGYLETVVVGKTGIFFNELTVDSLAKAIRRFSKQSLPLRGQMKWNKKTLQSHAKKFSKERFKKEMESFISKRI